MAETTIEWTNKTWNPTVGCTRIAPECKNCYAFELHDKRHAAHMAGKKLPDQYAKPFTELQLMPDRLDAPLHWRKPAMIFVNSVSDLFHEDVPDAYIAAVFAVMETCHWHAFQVLTKRYERMQRLLSHESFPMLVRKMGYDALGGSTYMERGPHWRMNQWLGTSVGCQKRLPAIEALRQTPAEIRFLSLEPLLEPLGQLDLTGIHWVIIGGESGPGARHCNIEWIWDLVKQCRAAGVPCFVKQMGANCGYAGDRWEWFQGKASTTAEEVGYKGVRRLKDPKGGDPAEWPEDLRVREFPSVLKDQP